MIISTKGRYAVRIMLDVAQNAGSGAVKAADISARQGITVKYVEQIISMLVKGGLLRSVRGAGGGYVLIKKPWEYRILEILNKTEGELIPSECLVDEDYCPRQGYCVTKSLWDGLYRAITSYLNGVTLQSLIDQSCDGSDLYCI